MNKHTPGPFKVVKWGDGKLSVDSAGANTIACINDAGPETLPNATLLAAAPELLGLLRQAYDRFTDNDMMPPNAKLQTWLGQTQAALDKAEGKES